jgi:hypothetical protein
MQAVLADPEHDRERLVPVALARNGELNAQ